MTTELYQVELRGNDVVFRALQQLDQQAKQAASSFPSNAGPAQAAASGLSQKVNGLADAFKMVSRDIGTLGGAGAQAFTHMADEALSIVGILTGGVGITAAIAVVGIAIGALRALWVAEEEKMRKASEDRKQAMRDTESLIKSLATGIVEAGQDASEQQITRLRAEVEATQTVIEVKRANLLVTQRLHSGTSDQLIELSKLEKAELSDIATLEKSNAARETTIGNLEKELEKRKEMQKKIEEHGKWRQDNAKAQAVRTEVWNDLKSQWMGAAMWASVFGPVAEQNIANDRALAESNRELARGIVENLDQVEAAWREVLSVQEAYYNETDAGALAQFSRVLSDERSGLAQKKQALLEIQSVEFEAEQRRRDAYLEDLNQQVAQRRLTEDQATALAITDGQLAAKRMENRRAETQAAIDALDRQRQEQIKTNAAMLYAAGVNTAYSTSMYGVGKSLDFASSELMRFQDINRDNWRDMLAITEDTKAAFAARLQAFLFTTAIEAGRMALMENAAGIMETARGAGALFTNPAEAASHFVSAGLHYAAAAAYGTFATGAGAGVAVLAAGRGQGGFVGSGAEKERERGAPGPGPEGPSGGYASARGERSSGERPTIIVNINNEPGSIAGQDQERAAAEVARHVQRAQRDWFTRYEMEH